jgi:hypothetical protein
MTGPSTFLLIHHSYIIGRSTSSVDRALQNKQMNNLMGCENDEVCTICDDAAVTYVGALSVHWTGRKQEPPSLITMFLTSSTFSAFYYVLKESKQLRRTIISVETASPLAEIRTENVFKKKVGRVTC